MLNGNIKYIIFDLGGVFLKPTRGHWFITPYIYELLKDKIDIESFKISLKNKYGLVNEVSLKTEEEEIRCFITIIKNL